MIKLACRVGLAPLVAFASLALLATRAQSQGSYPEQPVRILVGFPAGVAPDVSARLVAEKLAEAWGKYCVAGGRPVAEVVPIRSRGM